MLFHGLNTLSNSIVDARLLLALLDHLPLFPTVVLSIHAAG